MEQSQEVAAGIPSRLRLALLLMVLVVPAYLMVGGAAQMLNVAFGLWFTEVFVFLGVGFVLVQMTRRRPVDYVRMRYPGLAPLVFGAGVGAFNYFGAVIPIQALAVQWSPRFLKDLVPDVSQVFEQRSTLELALLVGAVAVAAPVCEEFCFRGILQQGLAGDGAGQSRRRAILWTAFIFSAFHLDPVGFWARFELGVLFGWLYVETGSLWTGVCAHAANNLTATALYFIFQNSDGDEGDTPARQILLFGAFGIAVLVGAAWLLRNVPALRRARTRHEDAPIPAETRSLYATAAPWFAAGFAALALLFALDWRGVRLNISDALHREAPAPKHETAEQKTAKAALSKLRGEARSGRLPVEEYVKQRDAKP